MEIYNDLGFLLVGMFIGMVVFSLVSVFMFRNSTQSFVEKDTGDVWHQKDIARDSNLRTLFILQSSRDCQTIALTKEERNNKFNVK